MHRKVSTIQSVERALQILNCFSLETPELGITELSKMLNVSKSTAHRLVTTMQKQGFLIQDRSTYKYKLSYSILRLSEIVLKNMSIRNIALPILQKLRDVTKETTSLNITSNNSRICIEKAESFQDLRQFIEIGRPLPLYAGASGKVLLAYQEEQTIRKILQEVELKPLTEKTIINPKQILRDLKAIKEKGYCFTAGEHIAGASSISAPIWNYNKKVIASLTVSGPSFRFTDQKIEEFVKLVLVGTAEISNKLGCQI